MTNWEEIARQSAKWRRENIVPIPSDCKINPEYLGSMSNGEFVAVFKEMQELIVSIYKGVEKAPFEWGYPEENNSKGLWASAYNRISDFFKGLVDNGIINGEKLVVNNKSIPKCRDCKASFKIAVSTHKKIEMIMDKLKHFGFEFHGYSTKAESFTVLYPKNPLIFTVMKTYANSKAQNFQFASFSYRGVEDPNVQTHEPLFLAEMDKSSKDMQEIGYWLYNKAKEYGYSINRDKPFDKGCIYYKKGSKEFILAGGREGRVFAKTIFRDVFKSHPEKISALAKKFPDTLGGSGTICKPHCSSIKDNESGKFNNPCLHRTCCKIDGTENKSCVCRYCPQRICYEIDGIKYRSCAYRSFYFENPTLDTFKDIFELFIIEKKVK